MPKDDDIEDVRSEEERRGKRPVDIAEKSRAHLLRKKFHEAIRSGNEEQFRQMLIQDLGQLPGSPAYIDSLKAWKTYHGE
jgi:hypothetical protein